MARRGAKQVIKEAFAGAEAIEAPAPEMEGGDFYGVDLPPGCPVTPLGVGVDTFYLMDCRRQFQAIEVGKLGRLKILQLFGQSQYLYQQWPQHNKDGEVTGWKHARVSERLVDACVARGIYDPVHRLRGPGGWRGPHGELVLHCGQRIYAGREIKQPGLIGDYVYPGAMQLPEPDFSGLDDEYSPARELMDTLMTFNWLRGEIDAKLVLGWYGAALIGAAASWRPMIWITGDSGSGKSTFQELTAALMGAALIRSENASQAGLFQRLGYSSLPVALDEAEAEQDDHRTRGIIQLARLAASGGVILRGSAGGDAVEFQARSTFAFSSVLIPPLRPADLNRMAICGLGPVKATSPIDLKRMAIVGRQLRAAILREWPRYDATFEAYVAALRSAGHNARGSQQFGALGAAYSLLMHEGLDQTSARAWAEMLPALELAEISDYEPDHAECLNRLLTVAPEIFRGGKTETIAYWLKTARADVEDAKSDSDAQRILASSGIVALPDPRFEKLKITERPWWIAVANSHVGTAKLFADTHWKAGASGSSGGWVQGLRRLPLSQWGAKQRMWIDGRGFRCTWVAWEIAFPQRD